MPIAQKKAMGDVFAIAARRDDEREQQAEQLDLLL